MTSAGTRNARYLSKDLRGIWLATPAIKTILERDAISLPHRLRVSCKRSLLAQRPITLVLMMINSCSYSTNNLVFNQYQIFDQDLSWCLASTKDLKSKFQRQHVLIQELAHQDCIKYSRGVQLIESRFGPSQEGEEDFQEKIFKKPCVMVVSIKILFLDKM